MLLVEEEEKEERLSPVNKVAFAFLWEGARLEAPQKSEWYDWLHLFLA